MSHQVAWRAQGWYVNGFEIASVDQQHGVINWTGSDGLPQGGWQGGRGWQLNGTDGSITPNPNFYVENIFEELDAPGEWFVDVEAQKLYLYYNGTGPPPSNESLVATNLQEMVGLRGGRGDEAVSDVTIQGLGFAHAGATFMEQWGVPSGGDWAFYRGGAIFLQGVQNVTVRSNRFLRIDGNGIVLSGFTRGVTLEDNDFAWIGEHDHRLAPPRVATCAGS